MVAQAVLAVAQEALHDMRERLERAREGQKVVQIQKVEHHAAKWSECRQRCPQVIEVRTEYAPVERERGVSPSEHAAIGLRIVVWIMDRHHLEFGMADQIVQCDPALGDVAFLKRTTHGGADGRSKVTTCFLEGILKARLLHPRPISAPHHTNQPPTRTPNPSP